MARKYEQERYGYKMLNRRGAIPTKRETVERKISEFYQQNKDKFEMRGIPEKSFKYEVLSLTSQKYGGNSKKNKILFSGNERKEANVYNAIERIVRSTDLASRNEISEYSIAKQLRDPVNAGLVNDIRNITKKSAIDLSGIKWDSSIGENGGYFLPAMGIWLIKRGDNYKDKGESPWLISY